jgi:hypothetical protein
MVNQGLRCTCEKESYGENITRLFLEENNIKFQQNYYQQINNEYFEFDFKLEKEINGISFIEIDGRFHKEPFSNTKKDLNDLEITQKRDAIRNNFCGSKLLRINISKLSNKKIKEKIQKILNEKLN